MKNITKIKVVELFAGVGAWSKALERINIDYEIVSAIEQDSKAIEAYNILHGTKFKPIDITEVKIEDIPECDVIFYSPPCQTFSAAGRQDGFEDPRGVLFFDALKIIQAKKPKYAIMENVKGLTQKKFQFEFETMLELLEQEGYINYIPDTKVINAKDYGIPQNRERVFIISIRKDIDQKFDFPKKKDYRFTLAEAIEEDATIPILHNIYGGFKEIEPRIFTDYSPTIRTSAGGGHIPSVVVKGCSLRTRSYMGQPQQLEVRKDEVSNAITTVPKDYMIAINGIEHIIEELPKGYKLVGNWVTRQMSTLEAWRLMGFNDEDHNKLVEAGYKKTNLYKLAGNSIVVDMVEAILKELFIKSEVCKMHNQ